MLFGLLTDVFYLLGIVVFRVLIRFSCSFIRFIIYYNSSIFLLLFECLLGFHLDLGKFL